MKERLDLLLVKNNLAGSREKAKSIIMSGIVYVEGQKEDKAGSMFDENSHIEIRGSTLRYVSRGGLKLEKAIEEFALVLKGLNCMDVGASTGGFTDCMLQNAAKKVYAVDVGYGQLDWKLRNDDRVKVFEKTNIRYLKREDIDDDIDMASIDVSFISLSKVLPSVYNLLSRDGFIIALIKPQFEAGREKVGKKGVVRDKATHIEVIHKICEYADAQNLNMTSLSFSPIRGPEGNIEYLCELRKRIDEKIYPGDKEIEELVDRAHKEFI